MSRLNSHALFQALQEILEQDFEEEVEHLLLRPPVAESLWVGAASGSLFHRFDRWLELQVRFAGDLTCLVPLGRPTLRKVHRKFGSDPPSGAAEGALLFDLQRRLGLPGLNVQGRAQYLAGCERLLVEAREGQLDEGRVATTARQLVERILRETALLFTHTDAGALFVEALTKDETIALPGKDVGHTDRTTLDLAWLRQRLGDENWGDLGFFALLLRRGSVAIVRRRAENPLLQIDVEVLNQEEYEAFVGLARALQPYVHFKPSQVSARWPALRDAVERATQSVRMMVARDVIPRAFVALEKVTGYFGTWYAGRDDAGRAIRLPSSEDLPLGRRLLIRLAENPVPQLLGWVPTCWD